MTMVYNTGLPEPREDHAEAMALFAYGCLRKMNRVLRKLEVVLGPDTSGESFRFVFLDNVYINLKLKTPSPSPPLKKTCSPFLC